MGPTEQGFIKATAAGEDKLAASIYKDLLEQVDNDDEEVSLVYTLFHPSIMALCVAPRVI